jgi:hypothetical protein
MDIRKGDHGLPDSHVKYRFNIFELDLIFIEIYLALHP